MPTNIVGPDPRRRPLDEAHTRAGTGSGQQHERNAMRAQFHTITAHTLESPSWCAWCAKALSVFGIIFRIDLLQNIVAAAATVYVHGHSSQFYSRICIIIHYFLKVVNYDTVVIMLMPPRPR
jgi:hypothetical protein